jgi:hypothetical protein
VHSSSLDVKIPASDTGMRPWMVRVRTGASVTER